MKPNAPPAPTARASRPDGIEARARLLQAALRLFAEKGFAKTSTREIAQAAGANIAAISYYFGDKAGLYGATFTEPMGGDASHLIAQFDVPGLAIEAALHVFVTGYAEPLKRGEVVRQCMRLHMRELVEPTQQLQTEIDRDVRGPHEAMVRVLCRHLQLSQADDDVHRLALAIAGLAMQLYVMRDVIDLLRPSLMASDAHIDTWAERLLGYALAMVAAEADRRRKAPPLRSDAAPTPERPQRRSKSHPA